MQTEITSSDCHSYSDLWEPLEKECCFCDCGTEIRLTDLFCTECIWHLNQQGGTQ